MGSFGRRGVGVALALGVACVCGCGPEAGAVTGGTGALVVPVEAIHAVGTSESVAHIADVVEGGDGTFWLLNTAEPYFLAMDAEGAITSSWGRQGGGPAEVRSPNALVVESGTGDVWAYDRIRHVLLRVNGSNGTPEVLTLDREVIDPSRVISLDNSSTFQGRVWLRTGENGFLLAVSRGGRSSAASVWDAHLMEISPDGTVSEGFAPGDVVGDPTTRYGEATQLLPLPLWTICPDGVSVYDPLANNVRRFAATGEEQAVHPLPPEMLREIDAEAVFGMVWPWMSQNPGLGELPDSAEYHELIRTQWPQFSPQFAEVFPEYADLRCAEDGSLWIQHFDPGFGQMGRSPGWLRIEPDGAMTEVVLPETFTPLRFEAGKILGVSRDLYGVESVAWMDEVF